MGVSGKILITSFEPFGLTGRFLRKANASEDIAVDIARTTDDRYDFIKLPVSDSSIMQFLSHVKETKPRGILCMGEEMIAPVGEVRIEPYAHDTQASMNFFKAARTRTIESPFVTEYLGVPSSRSRIGVYHCNALYKTALEWAQGQNNVPVAFAHIAVIGNRESQRHAIMDVLEWMSEAASAPALTPALKASL